MLRAAASLLVTMHVPRAEAKLGCQCHSTVGIYVFSYVHRLITYPPVPVATRLCNNGATACLDMSIGIAVSCMDTKYVLFAVIY